MMNKSVSVKVYHGYGHKHNLVVYGHVFQFKAETMQVYSDNIWVNIRYLFGLFRLKPYPYLRVRLTFRHQMVYGHTAYDGFFKFEWKAEGNLAAGWHGVKVEALDEYNAILASHDGLVYVPHVTQYAFISDIDDTVMVSHSAKIARRLRELFIKNPRTRKTFPEAQIHYKMLSLSHTHLDQPNPFFYVSSSEWNLYDYLVETFRFNHLPEGAFLLNQIKQWKDLIKTGKTGHEGKLMRVMRIIDAFPNQKFVFFGDNSQRDPVIYAAIARKYPQKVTAIYIRNVRKSKEEEARSILEEVDTAYAIATCLFKDSHEAILHSAQIGLITELPMAAYLKSK